MRIEIRATQRLCGSVELPASKSLTNRVLMVQALSGAPCSPGAMPPEAMLCDDTRAMLRALQEAPATVDVGAAGTAMRFLTALFSVLPGQHVLTGTERMKQRPIGILVDALRTLGAQITCTENEGYPPLHIVGGTCRGGRIALPGHVSSQYVSALLMAGPLLEGGLRMELTGRVASRPYIDMTLGVMRHYGAQAGWAAPGILQTAPGGYGQTTPLYIERDWSAASYWYQMMALCPDTEARVELPGLHSRSLQGDAVVRELFDSLGVATTFFVDEQGVEGVRLSKKAPRAGRMEFDFAQQPDLAQTLVATCCGLGIGFRFAGLESLRIKETDRIRALCAELGKLGFALSTPTEGTLFWDGRRGQAEARPVLATYQDHRMALCLAPLCLCLGPLEMEGGEVVSKSYPLFWQHMRQTGFVVHEKAAAPC